MNNKRRIKRSLLASIIIILILIQNVLVVGATTVTNTNDYVLVDNKRIAIPKTYIPVQSINNIGEIEEENKFLQEPLDLFISDAGNIFVVDTGNNRIVKLNNEGKTLAVFRGPKDKPLKNPTGIFVDETEDMYIADTGNERVVHLSPSGELVEIFTNPKSDLIDENASFKVTKLCISETGYIYLLRGESIMIMDSKNRFRGYLGQNKIGFNLVEVLIRKFASETQKNFLAKRNAATYTNLTMGSDGMIYATSRDQIEGEIKKLNTVGNNVYRKYGSAATEYSNPLTAKFIEMTQGFVQGTSFTFGERRTDEGMPTKPVFSDIAVDEMGIVTVIEDQTGKVYQYDQDGNILTVFGGTGEQKGLFNKPGSIDVDKEGRIYILDKLNNNIQIFEPTYFIQLVHQAVTAFNDGQYEKSYNLWEEVLTNNENYYLAHIGIGNTLYKQEKREPSMQQFKLADDRDGYSKSFTEYRYEIFRENFSVIIFFIVVLIILLYLFIKYTNRMSYKALKEFAISDHKMGFGEGLKIAFNIVYRPIYTLEVIKYNKNRLNMYVPSFILLVVFVTKVAIIFINHYPLAAIDPDDANILFEAIKILLPPLTWVVASFAVSSILDGESTMGQIYIATGYSMLPSILTYLPLAIVSNMMSLNEKGLYGTLTLGITIWILILFFMNLKELNHYSFIKAIVTYILCGLTMLLIWIIVSIMYVLTGRLYQFITGIITEIKMTLL